RLLRVLQEGEYTAAGGRTPIRADVRIVAATHRDLRQMVRSGLFREDLFYRLSDVPIRLPPLRERTEDIPELARHFLTQPQACGPCCRGPSPPPSAAAARSPPPCASSPRRTATCARWSARGCSARTSSIA